jgi:hypothetical protein
MSHIQGQPHPPGATEHLDYVRISVDPNGAISEVAVVTHHNLSGLDLPQHVTVYQLNPGPGLRDLAAVISAARRTALQGILTALAGAAALADDPLDPAPPLPNPAVR